MIRNDIYKALAEIRDKFRKSSKMLSIHGLNLMQCASLTKHSGPDSD